MHFFVWSLWWSSSPQQHDLHLYRRIDRIQHRTTAATFGWIYIIDGVEESTSIVPEEIASFTAIPINSTTKFLFVPSIHNNDWDDDDRRRATIFHQSTSLNLCRWKVGGSLRQNRISWSHTTTTSDDPPFDCAKLTWLNCDLILHQHFLQSENMFHSTHSDSGYKNIFQSQGKWMITDWE